MRLVFWLVLILCACFVSTADAQCSDGTCQIQPVRSVVKVTATRSMTVVKTLRQRRPIRSAIIRLRRCRGER